MVNKFILGTANLENSYGKFSNYLNLKDFKKIINSPKNKPAYIDTSLNYKNVHKILSKINLGNIKIITKISIPIKKNINPENWIFKNIRLIMKNLNVKSIYGVLIHNPSIFKKKELKDYIISLNKLKKKGIIKKTGFSVYNLKEANFLINNYDFNILQAPINIMDQSFCETIFLNKLSKKKIQLHARSIFLQGILLSSDLENDNYFKRWKNLWKKYYSWIEKNKISKLTACLTFVKKKRYISKIIIGVENQKQFDQILSNKRANNLKFEKFLFQKNEQLINPSKWKKI